MIRAGVRTGSLTEGRRSSPMAINKKSGRRPAKDNARQMFDSGTGCTAPSLVYPRGAFEGSERDSTP